MEKSNGMQITGFSFTSKGLVEIREIIEIPGNHESCKKQKSYMFLSMLYHCYIIMNTCIINPFYYYYLGPSIRVYPEIQSQLGSTNNIDVWR